MKFEVLTLKTNFNSVLSEVTPCILGQFAWCSEIKLLPSFPRWSRTMYVSPKRTRISACLDGVKCQSKFYLTPKRWLPVCESQHSAVGMSTRLRAVPPSDCVSTVGRAKRFSFVQSIQTGSWGSRHLFIRYCGLPLR